MNLDKNNKKKYFMVFMCMLLQAIPFTISQSIQPLFIPYVVDYFGFTLAGFSLIFTVGALAAAVFSPALGKLFDKINIKIIFIAGTSLATLGFLGFGFAKTLPVFYFFSAVAQIGASLFSGLGLPYVINHWFPKEGRGQALGIAFAGGSIGNIFLQQLASQSLANKGASISYIFFGAVAFLISLPIILCFIRLPKAGEIEETNEGKIEEKSEGFEGLGSKETMKNVYFWVVSIGYGIMSIAISALSTQYATYFTSELKFNATLIGTIGSIFALFALIGNIAGGALFDKIGTFKTMFISLVLQVISIGALLLTESTPALAFVFSIAYGLNVYSFMCARSYMCFDLFGKKDSSVILGVLSLVFAVGFALGSTLFGFIVDRSGFMAGWTVMLGCAVLGYVLLLIGIRVIKKRNSKFVNGN